ncbi:MAG: hypothetical protein OYL41_08860, partial [Acidobacteriota bacterium]|nr:hypothetical protein [Acidobacteriota bacterium]
ELCRARGLELDWTSEAPGHHLGPALCAVKRARLVEETRETIRETVAASTPEPEKAVPGERTLQAVAEIATRVNDGLTVREMLETERRRKREEELRRAPRPVPAPAPFQPEVLPASAAPEVLPPVKRAPEVPPPARTAPEVLPPRREPPQVLPPVRRRPEVLPPVRRQAAVFPPREVATELVAAEIKEELPREPAATLSGVERYIEQQRQTLAHALASAAMRKLSEDAKKRERARAASVQPAPASRIRRIADWVLDCARRVLERLGLMSAPAPEHEASPPPRQPEASPPPPPQPRPEPTLWERYQARWPEHAAADRAFFEDITEKPLPAALGHTILDGVDVWRRVIRGKFEGDQFQLDPVVPKPLPRSLAPADQASPDAAADAADYAGSLPRSYRWEFDEERIAERCREAAEGVRETWRYRFAGEERRQDLEDEAVRQACGADAQRLDREMHAERQRWQRHWDVLKRHDTLLSDEREQRELQRKCELQESMEQSRTTRAPERTGPEPTLTM